MNLQNDYYKILKYGTQKERTALFDSLPSAPLKFTFRCSLFELQDENILKLGFSYLCSFYCNGPEFSVGQRLSGALYQLSKEKYEIENKFNEGLFSSAYYYLNAVNKLGGHAYLIDFVKQFLIDLSINEFTFSFNEAEFSPETPGLSFRNGFQPLRTQQTNRLDSYLELKDFEYYLLIKILLGESLLATNKIDEAEKIVNNVEFNKSDLPLIKINWNNLSNCINQHKRNIFLLSQDNNSNREKEKKEERELLLNNTINFINNAAENLFTKEQSENINKGLDSALKNAPRIDFSNPEKRKEYDQLRGIVDRRVQGKENKGDKLFISDLVSKYTNKPEKKNIKIKCPSCNGMGKLACTKCGGSGITIYTYTGADIYSYIACGNRPVIKETCAYCGGTGGPSCSKCRGTGSIDQQIEV